MIFSESNQNEDAKNGCKNDFVEKYSHQFLGNRNAFNVVCYEREVL